MIEENLDDDGGIVCEKTQEKERGRVLNKKGAGCLH